MDEIKLRNEVDRGIKAEKLLKDPTLLEAFDTVETHISHMFKSAKIGDERSILKAKDLEYALSLVKRALIEVLETGKLAAQTLEDNRRGVSYLGDIWKTRSRR